jgi:hypothetical protein
VDLKDKAQAFRAELKRDPKGALSRLMDDGMEALSERYEVFRPEPADNPTMPVDAPTKETTAALEFEAVFVVTAGGNYHFVFSHQPTGLTDNAVDTRQRSVVCSIPAGADPDYFSPLEPVKITIAKADRVN